MRGSRGDSCGGQNPPPFCQIHCKIKEKYPHKIITRPPPLWTKFLDPRMTHDENIVRKIYVRIYHLIKIFT